MPFHCSLHANAYLVEILKVFHVNKVIFCAVRKKRNKKKKIVFITARVHPGETPAQYICQGIIDLLVSDTAEAKVKVLKECGISVSESVADIGSIMKTLMN